MLPFIPSSANVNQKHILKLYEKLSEQNRASLIAFAEFLAARDQGEDADDSDEVLQPKGLPRPQGESVVAAIKRLSDNYFMLDRQDMLSETASLMTAHVLQGRSALEVIDELESVFRSHYERYLESKQ